MTEQVPTDEELRHPVSSKLAVLGQPIMHSKSPTVHRAAYEVLGLDWHYESIECEAKSFQSLVGGFDTEWRGLSVTMPLKEEAHRFAAVLDPVGIESGVVNTLLRLTSGSGGASQWAGFNTDVEGLARAIARSGLDAAHTIVLGAGSTAVSAVLAARFLGAQQITVLGRNAGSVAKLVQKFSGTAEQGKAPVTVTGGGVSAGEGALTRDGSASATLVISTLPGQAGEHVELPRELYRVPLFDVAYDPWPSPLSIRWSEAGGEAYAGLEMLVEQALLQIRIFVNGDPAAPLDDEQAVLDAMRAASVER